LFAKVSSINNLRAAIEGRFKLIQTVDGSQEWLYDLRSDPGEKTDIREQQPAVAARLRKILARHVATNQEDRAEPSQTSITREQEAALRALGYTE
jgi:arylsulfatase A-like enzyme